MRAQHNTEDRVHRQAHTCMDAHHTHTHRKPPLEADIKANTISHNWLPHPIRAETAWAGGMQGSTLVQGGR